MDHAQLATLLFGQVFLACTVCACASTMIELLTSFKLLGPFQTGVAHVDRMVLTQPSGDKERQAAKAWCAVRMMINIH